MKRLMPLLLAAGLIAPTASAESFTAGGSTYTYTVKQTQKLNSGVTHHRLRFTSPKTLNVQIVEVNLSDPNVRVETTQGSDKMFTAQALTSRYTALKNAGRKPLVIQNASFWSMSSQKTVSDAGKYAVQSCLGGFVQNGQLIAETNADLDAWVGGPSIFAVMGIKDNKTGFVGHYKSNIRLMCPTRWGGNENLNILQPTEANRYCHYGTIAVFNKEFPSTKAIQVIDSRNGQGSNSSAMTSSDATYVYLSLKSGNTPAYNTWVEYEIKDIQRNCCSGTRGSYDLVVVFAIGSHSAVEALRVNDTMRMKYMWHPAGQYDPSSMTAIPGLENLVAGESMPMVNGVVQTPSSYGATTYSRSAYGISQDEKKLIMCVIDKSTDATYGSSAGCNTTVMSYIMQHWGAYNIVNCDAGGSAQMVINGKQVGTPSDSRGIVGSVVVFDEGSTSTGGEIVVPDDPGTGGGSTGGGSTGTGDMPNGSATAETPASGNANPYAYDVNGSWADNVLSFSYKLNAPAQAVELELYKDGEPVKSVTLSGKSKGSHSGTQSTADLAAGAYTWGISVTGDNHTNVREFHSLGFNHPQSVQVVTNPNNDYFGTILVTEGRPSTQEAHYTSTRGKQGIYLFTPQMEGIPNTSAGSGVYAFRGGLADVNYQYSVGGKSNGGCVPRKIRISDDDRIFVSTQSSTCSPVFEIRSLANMISSDAAWTQVTGGPIETTNYTWTDDNGNFSCAPTIGFDVKGSGANLTFAILGGKKAMFQSYTTSATTCHTYKLGNDLLWGSKVPTSSIAALTGKYLVNYTSANLTYDNVGGMWFSQYRGAPTETQPSIVYIDKNGKELFKNWSLVVGGGGLTFTHDYSQMLIATTTSTFSIFDINYATDGKPILTELKRITHGMGTNVNDYAFDVANNVYCCGNNGEKFKAFALPRTDNTVVTDAQAKYGFTIAEVEIPPVTPDPDPEPDPTPQLVEVTPAAGSANPFAYDITGEAVTEKRITTVTVNYTLNADAKAGSLLIHKSQGKSQSNHQRVDEGNPIELMTTLSASELTAGPHTVVVTIDDQAVGNGDFYYSIKIEGDPITTVSQFSQNKLYHPQGVEVVRDHASPYYGYILATEGKPIPSNKSDMASYVEGTNGTEGTGVYLFNPALVPVKNEKTGHNGFNGGLGNNTAMATGTSGTVARKIRMSEDGRIFLSTQANNCQPVYEIPDLETLVKDNPDFTPVIKGTQNADDYGFYDTNNTFICGPTVGMSVKGSGDNLKLAVLSGTLKYLTAISYSGAHFNEYALGSNAEWSGAPATFTNLNGKYAISPTSCNLEYDNRGGLWFSQHRGSPSAAQPSLKYLDANGDVKFSVESGLVVAGGGMRLSPDGRRMALASASKQFSIYDVNFDANGVPSLTERFRVHTTGNNTTDFAWDDAGNLYIVSPSSEVITGYAIPRDDTKTTTAAPSYEFTINDPPTGIENVADNNGSKGLKAWSVYTTPGTIHITGTAKSIEVFNVAGKLISKGKTTVKAKKGIYVVRVDGSSAKVAVK